MAISKDKKQQQLKQLVEDFTRAKLIVVAHNLGLSVSDAQLLRKALKSQNANLRVIKNTLVRLAIKEHASFKDIDLATFKGPTALAIGFEDEVSPAQILAKFSKDHPVIKIVAAINQDGTLLNEGQVNQLAALPSKDILRAQLVGTVAAPVYAFVNTLRANVQSVIYALEAIKRKQSNA